MRSSSVPRLLMTASVFAVVLGLGWLARSLADDYARDAALARAQATPGHREIGWQELVPDGWDPMRGFRHLDLRQLDDADPAARALLERMRRSWDEAPTNPALDGADVRLSGYLVPLESKRGSMREFLLVPYYGACIHTPPPAANQMVLVRLVTPASDLRTMDTVWVSGRLATRRTDSTVGASGYTLVAVHLERMRHPAP